MGIRGTSRPRAGAGVVLFALVLAWVAQPSVGATLAARSEPALRFAEQLAGRPAARALARGGAHVFRATGAADRSLAWSLQCAALARASRPAALSAEHDCVRIAALAAQRTGALGPAMRLLQRRQILAETLGDATGAVAALDAQAQLARRRTRYHEAEALARYALQRADAIGDLAGGADALSTLSLLHKNRGDYPEALELETQALARRERLGRAGRLHVSLLNLAALHEQLEDFPVAREHQARALSAAAHSPDPVDLTTARVSMAGLLNDSGPEYAPTALALARLAWDAQQRVGNRPGALDARFHVGRALLNLGELDAARGHFDAVLVEANTLGQRASQAHVWFRLSELAMARDDAAGAIAAAGRAAAIYRDLGNPHRLAKTYGLLERYHAAAGDTLASLVAARERLLLRERLLGAGAMQKINARLAEYRVDRDAAQIDLLRRDNQVQSLTLERNAIQRRFNGLIGALLVLALVALGVRVRTGERANRALAEHNRAIEAQRRRLSLVNSRLWVSATTDPLTGLANRARALEQLAELLADGARGAAAEPLALALIDIDHFKRINDTHGHLVGDSALRQVALALRDTLALASVVARLGGEEFLVVLANGAERDADAHLEAARDAIARLGIPGLGTLTVSIGWVRAEPGACADELLAAADAALYRAKARGRNAVERAPARSRRASA